MVYGRNLRPGTVISRENGWGVVDRVEPFGSGDATADVWMVGADSAIKVRMATAARMSPALRSVAALARSAWAERDQLRQRVAELEVALEPNVAKRLELATKLAVASTNLLRIERDEARARAAAHETDAAVAEEQNRDLRERITALEAAAAGAADSTTPVVTDAMVQAAIDGALDLAFESFPGPEGRETHRAHDANERTSGGYHGLCPFCRLAGAPESVASPARLRVFRAALEAGIAAAVPVSSTQAPVVTDAMVRAAVTEYFELDVPIETRLELRTDGERMRVALTAALAVGVPPAGIPTPDSTTREGKIKKCACGHSVGSHGHGYGHGCGVDLVGPDEMPCGCTRTMTSLITDTTEENR